MSALCFRFPALVSVCLRDHLYMACDKIVCRRREVGLLYLFESEIERWFCLRTYRATLDNEVDWSQEISEALSIFSNVCQHIYCRISQVFSSMNLGRFDFSSSLDQLGIQGKPWKPGEVTNTRAYRPCHLIMPTAEASHPGYLSPTSSSKMYLMATWFVDLWTPRPRKLSGNCSSLH